MILKKIDYQDAPKLNTNVGAHQTHCRLFEI